MTSTATTLHDRIRSETHRLAKMIEALADLTPAQRCDLRAVVLQLEACAQDARDMESGGFWP